MGLGSIKVTSEAVINDAVRLKKEEFKELYVKEFGYHELDASRAWHQCRVSRRGRELLTKLVAPLVNVEEQEFVIPDLSSLEVKDLTPDLFAPGDTIIVKLKDGIDYATTVTKMTTLVSDGLRYVKYKSPDGKVALKRPSAVMLVKKK